MNIVLYSYNKCPFCERARFALNYSKIPYKLIEVPLPNKPKELFDYSPKGTVPVLVINKKEIIDESTEIVKFAANNDYWEKLEDKFIDSFMEDFNDTIIPAFKDNRSGDFTAQSFNKCKSFLDKLEQALEKNQYLAGNKISVLDVLIFPFIIFLLDIKGSYSYPHFKNWLVDIRKLFES